MKTQYTKANQFIDWEIYQVNDRPSLSVIANARLREAAPAMLAALENALIDPDDDHARQVVEQAIKQAKGD